jgi:tRNA(adenine34) deaminase
MKHIYEEFMKAAVAEARRSKTPFGCVLVRNGSIVQGAGNTVKQDHDVSAHAEMNALRALMRQLRSTDLSEYTLYTTCEPCPMCMSACVYAGIRMIVYGVSIQQAKQYTSQILISCQDIAAKSSNNHVLTIPGILVDSCLQLFEEYAV